MIIAVILIAAIACALASVLRGAKRCESSDRPSLPAVGSLFDFCKLQSPTARGTAPFVAVCGESAEKLSCVLAIREHGGRVIGPFAENALLVELGAKMLTKVRDDSRFASVRELAPEEKFHADFVDGKVTVTVLTDGDASRIGKFIAQEGGNIVEEEHSPIEIVATLSQSLAVKLARKGEVRRIQKYQRPERVGK